MSIMGTNSHIIGGLESLPLNDPVAPPIKITKELLKSRGDLRSALCLLWDRVGRTYFPVPGLSLVFVYQHVRYIVESIDFVEAMECNEVPETGTIDPNYVERDSLDYLQQKRE